MFYHPFYKCTERQCSCVIATMSDGSPRMVNGGIAIFFFESSTNEQDFMTPRQQPVRSRIIRVERQCPLEQRYRLGSLLRHGGRDMGSGAQNKVVGVETIRPFACDPFDFRLAQARLDRANDV